MEIVREAKKQGLRITADVGYYLHLRFILELLIQIVRLSHHFVGRETGMPYGGLLDGTIDA